MMPFYRWAKNRGKGFYVYEQFSAKNIYDKKNRGISLSSNDLMDVLISELAFHLNFLKKHKLIIIAHSFGGVLLSEYVLNYHDSLKGHDVVFSGFCPYRPEFLEYNVKVMLELNDDEVFREKFICNKNSLNKKQFLGLITQPYGCIDIKDSYLNELSLFQSNNYYTYGEYDICSSEQVEIAKKRLPNCKSVMIQNVSHYPFISAPKIYFKMLENMLFNN
ncbi:hypothetical protein [Photorhabdus viridis]|uniref:hypothetical protein n=1 Tax=Photorhabdus viridis TaxID=3163327 RepID=UPI00330735FF